MSGVNIHNQQWGSYATPGLNNPPQLWLNGVDRGSVTDCEFELLQRGPGILVNHYYNNDLVIANNRFFTAQIGTPSGPIDEISPQAIKFYSLPLGTSTRADGGTMIHVSGNVGRGLDNTFFEANGMPLGATGPVMWTGLPFDTTRTLTNASGAVTLQTVGTSPSAFPRIVASGGDANLFDGVMAGDFFDLSGSTVSGTLLTSNKGLMYVVDVDTGQAPDDADGSIDWIDLAITNPLTLGMFTDFVSDETPAAGTLTLRFHPRNLSTNMSYSD